MSQCGACTSQHVSKCTRDTWMPIWKLWLIAIKCSNEYKSNASAKTIVKYWEERDPIYNIILFHLHTPSLFYITYKKKFALPEVTNYLRNRYLSQHLYGNWCTMQPIVKPKLYLHIVTPAPLDIFSLLAFAFAPVVLLWLHLVSCRYHLIVMFYINIIVSHLIYVYL